MGLENAVAIVNFPSFNLKRRLVWKAYTIGYVQPQIVWSAQLARRVIAPCLLCSTRLLAMVVVMSILANGKTTPCED